MEYLIEKCMQFQSNPEQNKYNIKMRLIKQDTKIWSGFNPAHGRDNWGRDGIVLYVD
jgi:hypothetical protein